MLSDTMMLGGGRKAAYSIENSLLFRGDQYLRRTPAVAGNRKTWTFSAWVRRNKLGERHTLFSSSTDSRGWDCHTVHFGADDKLTFSVAVGTGMAACATTSVFRDPTAWLHVVAVFDTTNTVLADGMRLYVNGVRMPVSQAAGSSQPWPIARNSDGFINSAAAHDIGRTGYLSDYYANLQMSEVCFVDGQAQPPSAFGETDPSTGSWRPKKIADIELGPNGFHLGNPWKAAGLGTDCSGRGNNWTANGFIAGTEIVADTPTNVYATLSPLVGTNTQWTLLRNGNTYLRQRTDNQAFYAYYASAKLDQLIRGKVYFEVKTTGTFNNGAGGLQRHPCFSLGNIFVQYLDGAPATWRIAIDASGGKVWVAKDSGAWIGGGDPLAGTSSTQGFTGDVLAGFTAFYGSGQYGDFDCQVEINTGQRPFVYAVPVGFSGLCTASQLPTTGVSTGSFSGNANTDGPWIYTGAVPQTLVVNGNPVTWGTHADKLAMGFKIRTASTSYNSIGTNTWTATYDRKPTVGPKGRAPANAQAN